MFLVSRIRVSHYLYSSGSEFFHQQAKKNPDFLLLFRFLSLKTDVNVPSKRNWKKKHDPAPEPDP
jgi:hypothetical protein